MTTQELQKLYKEFMEYTSDYGKSMQAWYMPTARSRKWRKASLIVSLTSDNWQVINTLKAENGWNRTAWFELGYDPNASGIKW